VRLNDGKYKQLEKVANVSDCKILTRN